MTFRTIAAELQHVKAERDAYLAYAALLQSISTLKGDYSEWTPAEAVEHVRRQAVMICREASDAGWSAADVVRLAECREAVRAAREHDR
jgi:hypothetical protein